MKKTKILYLLLIGFAISAGSMVPAYAGINLQPDFSGSILVTFPNGEIQMIEPGQPIPVIPPDSVLQIFKGHLTVSTDKGESVQVSCLGQSAKIEGGSSATMSCTEKSEDSGLLKVLKGKVTLLKGEDVVSVLDEGSEYPIKLFKGELAPPPPTGEGETLGGAPVGGDLADPPPVDSRSIQSSVSQ